MPTKDFENKGVAVNAFTGRQTQDLIHVGTLHKHALNNEPHADVDGLHRELNGLHVGAIEEQNSGPDTTMPHSPAQRNNDVVQISSRLTDASVSGSVPNGQHHSSLASSERSAMHRWHAEEADDQPWTPFRHQTVAVYNGHNQDDNTKV